jgi:serine/threonine-protein kinase PpkA
MSMAKNKIMLRYFAAAAGLFMLLLNPLHSLADTPLLQAGKRTIYQRVIVHPGAALFQEAAESAEVLQKAVTPFTVFYVYERQGDWLRVGRGAGQSQGWMKAAAGTEWNQAMTLLFTERAGRMPVLFFKNEETLFDICGSDNMSGKLKNILAQLNQIRENGPGDDFPLVAAEPDDEQGAVARSRFYLIPVLAVDEPFSGTKFLQVASIDPGGAQGQDENGQEQNEGKMRTAIAFVIDTTISMKPYIEQSLNVVRQTYDVIEKDNLGDSVGFAIVAFRNNIKISPGLEYVTNVVSDFTTVSNREELEKNLSEVSEASSSSHSFNEDSMAGIKTAVDSLSWDNYESRIIILISDAGPLPAGDSSAAGRMDVSEMQDYAKSKNIWITALHVRTPAGARNHAEAEKAYRQLTRLSDSSSSYVAIPAPDARSGAGSFAKAASTLAGSMAKVVQATAARQRLAKPEERAAADTPENEAARIAQTIGYAMQLDFLGKQRRNQAPRVVKAWIADMDLERLAQGRNTPGVEVAVLLTKNQLSDLQRQLKIIIDEAERVKRTDARDFFNSILSASSSLVRDPNLFSTNPGRNLQQLGVLGEFLEGLPYKSDIMMLTEDDWYRMSVGEQTAFINRLKSRIARYEEYDKDTSNWESFGVPNAGDWVYRVPLSMLP